MTNDLHKIVNARKRELLNLSPDPNEVELPTPGTQLLEIHSPQWGGIKFNRNYHINVQHGTEHAYVRYKCRCKLCSEASTAARQKRRQLND